MCTARHARHAHTWDTGIEAAQHQAKQIKQMRREGMVRVRDAHSLRHPSSKQTQASSLVQSEEVIVPSREEHLLPQH
jgi:hypothetical protein